MYQTCFRSFLVFLFFLNGGILADTDMEKMDSQTRVFLERINSTNEPELEAESIEEMDICKKAMADIAQFLRTYPNKASG